MKAPEPTRRQRRSAALREAILLAAERELREHGAERFGVERVAAAADVAVQTLYNHFGGRDGLLLAVAERALDTDRTYMDEAYAVEAPVERVLAAARAYGRFALHYPEQFRLLAFPPGGSAEQAGPSAEIAQRVADGVRLQNQRLAAALRDAAIAGSARPVDADLVATALWAMLNGLLALSWRADSLRADPAEMEALLSAAVDVLFVGLTSSAEGKPPD